MRMKRSGRTNIVVVVTIALVAAVLALFLLAGNSPSTIATKFLIALSKGDAKTLAENSYMEGVSPSEAEKRWAKTYETSKYWVFAYQILDTKEQDANNATVRLDWIKSANSGSSYSEKYELPMVRKDGQWKVDVRGISREMYPALPR
jgi:hypothetical protein